LTEAPDATNDFFGLVRLIEALERADGKNLHDMKRDVLTAVRTHTGGSLAHDDVTLLGIEIG